MTYVQAKEIADRFAYLVGAIYQNMATVSKVFPAPKDYTLRKNYEDLVVVNAMRLPELPLDLRDEDMGVFVYLRNNQDSTIVSFPTLNVFLAKHPELNKTDLAEIPD